MEELCLQPFFLRIIYYLKIFLNIIRFVVPMILIIKVFLNVFKGIINPKEEEGIKKIKNSVIASIIIFFIPTVIGLTMKLIEYIVGVNTYNGVTECYDFANLEYIKVIEKQIKEEELKKYLTEQEQALERYTQRKLAYKKIVLSNQNALKIGENSNNNNAIKCDTGSNYNTELYNNVRSAGYKTREGVVAAALYLSSHIDVHIPYFWSGGHNHTYNGYKDYGENMLGVPDKWGCQVKMAYGGTDLQKDGKLYPFGIDCSGFINWAILNGGYYAGNGSKDSVIVSTNAKPSTTLKGIKIEVIKSKNAKGKIKLGDIAHRDGHVGIIVEISNNSYKVAEEAGYENGLIIKKYNYGEGFTNILLMDNFYNNYQKEEPLWNGFI